jgi:hypothetical protein
MMKQKSKKRRLFGLLNMREQILLVTIVGVLLYMGLACTKRKWESISASRKKNLEKGLMHEEWKSKKSNLEDEFHNVIQHVMKQEKVDEKHLMEVAEKAARETKVRYEVDPPVTEKNGIFEKHKTTVRLQNASMEDLLVFDESIEREQANVRIDEMEVLGGRNGDISTKATISSLNLIPEDDLLQEVADVLGTPELLQIYGDTSLTQQLLDIYE